MDEQSEARPGHPGPAGGVPVCVDLDGTLVKSDTLVDSVLAIARQNPALLARFPGWLVKGKAAFKLHVASSIALDVESLPYNQPLLAWLREQHALGRPLYLATASDSRLADRVAAHLGLFAGVLASDGHTNLAGTHKLDAFRERFGDRFSYIGNARPDVPLLIACDAPMVANPHKSLLTGLRKARIQPVATFIDTTSPLRAWLKAVRLHQWAKNTLIFVPAMLAHRRAAAPLAGAVTAFFSFGCCASATYIVNDLLDIGADRCHPRKRRRPFAAGDLSAFAGVAAVAGLLVAALLLGLALPHIVNAMPGSYLLPRPYSFLGWLGLYTVTTLAYSLYLKRRLLLDVFVLSGLYTVRILAGSAATGVDVSAWLAGFSVFFFLSLAFVKRFSELHGLRETDLAAGAAISGRGYVAADLEQLRALGTGAAYAAVVVLTLYINNPDISLLYQHPTRLWLAVLVMLLWISRIWMLAGRGHMHDDPVVFAITDKRSLMLGVLMAVVVWFAV